MAHRKLKQVITQFEDMGVSVCREKGMLYFKGKGTPIPTCREVDDRLFSKMKRDLNISAGAQLAR